MTFDFNVFQRRNRKDDSVRLVKRIVCEDGFSFSAQASEYAYSSPRESGLAWYDSVEVGFPSEVEELLMPHIDGGSGDPTQSVYGYVPVEVVNAVVAKHGGLYSTK
jgi:hypothetical protein